MSLLPAVQNGPSNRTPPLAVLGLIAAGMAGNYFGYEVFFNVHFIFGSICSMLALQLFGLGWGVLAGLFISSSSWLLWNHPYAIVIFTAEVLVVGLLTRYRNMSFVGADVGYWLFLGIPLVYLFYSGVMHLSFSGSAVMMMKQTVNGVINVALARLFFFGLRYGAGRGPVSMKEMLLTLLALFVLVPTISLLSMQSRAELRDADRSARLALQFAGQRIPQAVEAWLQSHQNVINHVAWLAAHQPIPAMQRALERLSAADPDFLRIGLLNEGATAIAFSPLVDDRGRENIGKKFADRPFIPVVKRTLKPLLSEVYMGRVGAPKPVASQVAPVVRSRRYAGYAIGVLDLDRVREMISLNLKDNSLPQASYLLLDRNNNVIVSSRHDVQVLSPFIRERGQTEQVEEGITRWTPQNVKNKPVSEQWKQTLYYHESRIGDMAEWKLILEQPLAPFQQRMYERYTGNLTWVFSIFLAALFAAELVSRQAVRPIVELSRVSSGLPKQIAAGTEVIWPESAIMETEQLIYNFRDMAQVTALQFHHIRKMNSQLEERIAKRTRELQESEERLNRAQAVAKVGSWEWDIGTNELNWSDEVYRIYGEDRSRKPSYDIVIRTLAPECREAFTSAIEAALREGRHFEGEYRIIALDGTVRYTHTVGEVVRDAEGRPVSMFGVVQEISERKQAEIALRKSEERYRAIVENQTDFIDRYVAGGILTFVNESLARYTGNKPEELVGTSFYSYLHPDDREATIRAIESLSRQNPSVITENRVLLPDGSERQHQWTHSALFDSDGRIVEYQSVGRDITDSRQSEERVRQLANEQRVILDSVAIGIAYLKNRHFVWANPAFERIFGYEHGAYQGQDTRMIYADASDYERIGREGYARISSDASYTTEAEVVKKDGTLFWISLTGRAVNPEAPTEGSIWLFQDITDRRRSEEALRDRTHQLEDLTRDLEKMVEDEIAMRVKNEQLLVQQSKMAAMGEMLGAIAHQWRQPLNALGLIVQNLRDAYTYGELDRDYLERTVQKSMDQIQHMSKTIDDFRDFFQPDKEKTVFDTMQALGSVLTLFSAQLAANDISFRLTCHTHSRSFLNVGDIVACPDKTVRGFRNEFEHVMLNLINNARDAIQERRGAGKAGAQGSMQFDFFNAEGRIIIKTSDNGGGIAPDVIGRIFEPYFTTKHPAKGTGLGLYMSKVIIEEHMGGRLSAENDGQGAVFTIELPQAGAKHG